MKQQSWDTETAEETTSLLLSPFIYSLHIQFVMPEYTLQEKAEMGDYFFLSLSFWCFHTLTVWAVDRYGRDVY